MMMMTTNTAGTITAQQFSFGMIDSFVSYIDRCEKTTKTYITNLRSFAAWMLFAGIRQPIREDIVTYRDYLAAEHDAIHLDNTTPAGWSYRTDRKGNRVQIVCKPSTIKGYLQSVCQFFKWLASENLYPDIASGIHAPKIRQDFHKKDALEAADVQKIENKIETTTEQGKRLYAMFLLTVNAGLRTIELSRANVKDIENKGGTTYMLIWGKGHCEADTRKALAPEVAEAINDYLQSRSDKPTGKSPLFVATGNRSGGKRIASTTISTMLKKAMQQAGYNSERLTAHSLRHTAGTSVQEIGGDLYLTQQYMRHASATTTEIYLHNDTEQREAEIAKLLYDFYHGISRNEEPRQKLDNIISRMNPGQIEQLATIAAAMNH